MYLCFHFSLPKNLLCKYLSRRFRKKRLVSPVLDVEQQILYLDKIFYHEIFSLYPFITSDKSCVIIYTYKSDVTFARHRSFGYSSEQQTHNYFCAIIREIMNSSETQAIASDNDNTKTRYIKIHLFFLSSISSILVVLDLLIIHEDILCIASKIYVPMAESSILQLTRCCDNNVRNQLKIRLDFSINFGGGGGGFVRRLAEFLNWLACATAIETLSVAMLRAARE